MRTKRLLAAILVLLTTPAGIAGTATAGEAHQGRHSACELVTVLVAVEHVEYRRGAAVLRTYFHVVHNVRPRGTTLAPAATSCAKLVAAVGQEALR